MILAQTTFAEELISKALYLSEQHKKNYKQKNINVLGAFQLERHTASGEKLMEFSGLAWDKDEQLLYALSDRGFIVHLHPVFKKTHLTNLYFIAKYPLRDSGGKKLVHKHADSEGLALLNSSNQKAGDTELIVSYERIPRIIKYTVDGNFLSNIPLPDILKDIKNYAGENKSLEALSLHKDFNIITGPERPLKNSNKDKLSLYSLNNEHWSFTPDNKKYGSLVGLTTLPNGSLLALERIFPGILAGVTSVFHKISIDKNGLSERELTSLQPVDGILNENFEGISWHKDNRFFMISDDNDSLFQRTILLYFEILNLDDTSHD